MLPIFVLLQASTKVLCFQVQNKIVLSRLTHDISELRWRVEEAKLRLTGELKVSLVTKRKKTTKLLQIFKQVKQNYPASYCLTE